MNKKVLNQLKGGLIVSCQALEYEPDNVDKQCTGYCKD